MAVRVGDALPPISAPTHTGPLNLGDFRGSKSIVLWAYPKDMTSGCTSEARDFSRLSPAFAELDAVTVGISRDTADSHRAFAAQNDLTIPLLSDPDGKICSMLGILPDPSGNPKRTTFIVDKTGAIRYIFEAVKVPGHAEQVLEKVREMNS